MTPLVPSSRLDSRCFREHPLQQCLFGGGKLQLAQSTVCSTQLCTVLCLLCPRFVVVLAKPEPKPSTVSSASLQSCGGLSEQAGLLRFIPGALKPCSQQGLQLGPGPRSLASVCSFAQLVAPTPPPPWTAPLGLGSHGPLWVLAHPAPPVSEAPGSSAPPGAHRSRQPRRQFATPSQGTGFFSRRVLSPPKDGPGLHPGGLSIPSSCGLSA